MKNDKIRVGIGGYPCVVSGHKLRNSDAVTALIEWLG